MHGVPWTIARWPPAQSLICIAAMADTGENEAQNKSCRIGNQYTRAKQMYLESRLQRNGEEDGSSFLNREATGGRIAARLLKPTAPHQIIQRLRESG
ncbi:hypothetical protein C8R44DRAFT_804337 [Mycena epipterygia]|nr:hypothetical protein C8R44DRAFT_804337 [Mycena epipterygia]